MKAFVFDPANSDPHSAFGGVTPDDIRIGGKRRFRKGHRFTADDLPDLARVEHPIHIILIEPDEYTRMMPRLRWPRQSPGRASSAATRSRVGST